MSLSIARLAAGLATALVLTACASDGPSVFGGGGSSGGEAESSGIQTRAIRSAPSTREAQNESRPLSELNTPDAIAAREAAARAAAPASTPVARPVAQVAAPAAGSVTAPLPPPPSAKAALPQKGEKVWVRDGAALYSRPATSSDRAPIPAGELELGTQMYNAGGYWWYVQAGKESGWLSQADIQR